MSRILMVIDGTRGDTQPYMVAAQALMRAGFETMVTGPGDMNKPAADFEVPFTRSRLSNQKVFTDPETTATFNGQSIPTLLGAINDAEAK